jgi:hypothetical protein
MADLTYLKTLVFYPLYYWLFYYAARDLMRTRLWLAAMLVRCRRRRSGGLVGSDFLWHWQLCRKPSCCWPVRTGFLLGQSRGCVLRDVSADVARAAAVSEDPTTVSIDRTGECADPAGRHPVHLFASSLCHRPAGHGVARLQARHRHGNARSGRLPDCAAWLPQGATERVEETQQAGEYGQAQYDESTESRWILWEGGLAMWVENPFGIGANRFKSEIGNYSRYSGKDAHNYYVLTLAESRLAGLCCRCCGWYGRCGGSADDYPVPRSTPRVAHWPTDFRVAVLAMMLGNIYGSPFSEGAIMGVFWAPDRPDGALHAACVGRQHRRPARRSDSAQAAHAPMAASASPRGNMP